MFKLGGYNQSIDMWAIGVITFEILSGFLPFNEEMVMDT